MTPLDHVDLTAARRWLQILDPERERWWFRALNGDNARNLEGALDELALQLSQMNRQGYSIFATVQCADPTQWRPPVTPPGRGEGIKTEHVTRIVAVFADLDGSPLEPAMRDLDPHLVVETSPGRWHVYWLVDGLELGEYTGVQKAIAARYGADPRVSDLPRIMRVPGFVNRKYTSESTAARIVHDSGAQPYPAQTIRHTWPAAAAPWSAPEGGTGRPTIATLASGVTEGRRNHSLASLTGHFLARGVDPDAVREFALAWSQARCNPPMDPGEARRTIDSIVARAGGVHTWPVPLDLAALGRREPEAPPMIVDDWLPAGYATLIAGHGGAGKSSIALHLAACIALGREFAGLTPQRRRVLYLACEDRARVLHWRLARICRHMDVDMAELAGQLEVLDLVGRDSILWERTAAGGRTTPAFNQLMAAARGVDVIVVDGVADTYAGSENDRGDVKRYVNALVGLIHPDRGAVLLIHHVNKPAAGTATSEGYSGSTGWHNSARARWYLYPETAQSDESVERTGRLILELQKSNLGRADQSITFRWDEAAHLFVAEAMPQTSHMAEFSRDTDERDGIVAAIQAVEARGDYVPAAMQGPRTAWHVLTAVEGFPATLKGTRERRRFWRHIEHLRRIQTVRESSIRRSNRHIVPTLTLQATAGAGCADVPHSSFENRARNDAGAPAPNASYSAGGYRGCVRAHCPRCDDEGCDWCERPTEGAAA